MGSIPQLANWTYLFDPTQVAPIWGIPQDRFAVLSDSRGLALSFETRYAIYTSFIDFHMINDSLSRPTKFGSGIQHLKEGGDRVVHPASHIEAPISFGTEVRPGSTFRNGEVSLDLRGVGIVDGRPCALVGYDVSDSTPRMTHVTRDGTNVAVEGMSQFRGDIYIDLSSKIVRKATIDEHLIAQARAGAEPPTVEYTIRHILFRMVNDA